MADFYKTVDEKILFTGDGELIYYIPEKYFDIKVAISYGEYIDTMGIFSYGIYDKSGKQLVLKPFKLPTIFRCRPSTITKESKFHLKGTSEPMAYRLLHFKKDDELISSTAIPKDVDNVESFMHLLIRANLPETIPYNELQDYILQNAEINGFNYKVTPQIIGLIISELCRDPNDLSKPFRYTDMKNMNGYKPISILKIPKYTSPYTAITSENADEAIAAAMTVKSNTPSPLEKIMMEDMTITDGGTPLTDILIENGILYKLEDEFDIFYNDF